MAQINKYGATSNTLAEYLVMMRERYLEIDNSWNIDPESPDGLMIAAWSEILANLDEAVIQAYHSADPNSAIGQQLDRIARFAGLWRQASTHSTATVTFAGSPLIRIPKGTQVRHRGTDTLWQTDQETATDTSGQATVNVTCIDAGAHSANANNLTIIASSVGGITAVTNAAAASVGLDEERDTTFRIRRMNSVALPGNNQIDNMYSAVHNVRGIRQIKIYENINSVPDELGILDHSMAIFVDGGGTEDIARTIASKKNPGCGLNRYNNIPNKIHIKTLTLKNQPAHITFFRPELVSVHVRIEIASSTRFDDPVIKDAVVDYSLIGFDETKGFAKAGFLIGESIGAGRLFTPVNYFVAANGYVNNITIGTDANNVTYNSIAIKYNQLGVFDAGNIEIVYV